MVQQIINVLFLAISYFAQGLTGFGGNILAVSLLSLTLSIEDAKAIANVIAVITCVSVLAGSWREVNWKEYFKMLVPMTIGTVIGIYICSGFSADSILLGILGVILIVLGIYKLKDSRYIQFTVIGQIIILLLSGLLQGVYACGGVTLIIYAVNVLKEKESFRSTKSMIFLSMTLLMIGLQAGQGVYTPEVNHLIMLSLAPAIITVIIANKIASKINTELMLKVIYVLLILMGIILIGKAL
jgi:uncharacterized membrane protein YfcA